MTYYSKLIAAIVGLLVIFATRYGIDLEGSQQVIIDGLVAVATAVGVYLAKNKPTNEDQRAEALQTAQEATKH